MLIVFVISDSGPIIQLMLVFLLNIFMLIHTGFTQPFNSRLQNRIILMNELGIGLITYHMLYFTDWVADQSVQSNYGWSMIGFCSFFTGFNCIFVLFYGGKSAYLLCLKYGPRAHVRIKRLEQLYESYKARQEREMVQEFQNPEEQPEEEPEQAEEVKDNLE